MSLQIGSYKNNQDVDAKLRAYKELLALQSNLQMRQEEANKAVYKDGTANPVPATEIPRYGSVEEELADLGAQKIIMVETLGKIFKYPKDAKATMDAFLEEGYIPSDFNRLSTDFLDTIKNIKVLTPEFFMRNWERYYTRVQSQGDSLTSIGIADDQARANIKTKMVRIVNQYLKPMFSEIPQEFEDARRVLNYQMEMAEPGSEQEGQLQDIINAYEYADDPAEKQSSILSMLARLTKATPNEYIGRVVPEVGEEKTTAPLLSLDFLANREGGTKQVYESTFGSSTVKNQRLALKGVITDKDQRQALKAELPTVATALNKTVQEYNTMNRASLASLFQTLTGKSAPKTFDRTDLLYMNAMLVLESIKRAPVPKGPRAQEEWWSDQPEEKGPEMSSSMELARVQERKLGRVKQSEFYKEQPYVPKSFMSPRIIRQEMFFGSNNPRYWAEMPKSMYVPEKQESQKLLMSPEESQGFRFNPEAETFTFQEVPESESKEQFLKQPAWARLNDEAGVDIVDRKGQIISGISTEKVISAARNIYGDQQLENMGLNISGKQTIQNVRYLKRAILDRLREMEQFDFTSSSFGQGLPSKIMPVKRGRIARDYIVGRGLPLEPQEKMVQFGCYQIHKPFLYKMNRLSVKYPSGAQVLHFGSRIISEELATLIKHILETHKMDYKLFDKLDQKDKELFQNLIQKCQLDQQLGLDGFRDEEFEKQYKRFELLRGEILAGNNNFDMLKELRTLILHFMSVGKMKKPEGNQILFEINSIISTDK